MKTAWEKLFLAPEEQLTRKEHEEIFRDLAVAVARVEAMQSSPEHERILRLIEKQLKGNAPFR